jgi:signal transduction histidine kinase
VAIGVAGGREAPTTLILRDIFERRSAERVVLDASEELQRRIGQDLHDGLGQLLTGTAFLAKDLERALIGDHAARVKRLVDLLNQAIDQVRTLAKGLSPLHLEKYELAMVLGELARDTTQMFGVECRFEGIEPAGCDDLITRTHLYRIAREAVLNAIKHGGATRIDISLASAGERFALSIRDNGTGIARDLARGGIGLPSMRHRARMLGGQLEVGERKPSGVEVVCLFSPTPARS